MEEIKLGTVELRFAEIVWQNEPLSSGELVKRCAAELNWKKSTTYTVLKKLCDRGILQNCDGTVSSRLSRQEYDSRQSEQFVDEAFHGSLPAFLAAFTARKSLSPEDIAQLRRLVEEYEEG